MPTYEYRCSNCLRFYDDLRPSSERALPYVCPRCGNQCDFQAVPSRPPAFLQKSKAEEFRHRERSDAPTVLENISLVGGKYGIVADASVPLKARNLNFDGTAIPLTILPAPDAPHSLQQPTVSTLKVRRSSRAVVLFGAGASFGSGDVAPHPPPLGKGLFLELEKRPLPENLTPATRLVFRENFEAGMARYFEESSGNVMEFQRRLAAYLAQFRPGPKNTYGELARVLSRFDVLYSTLNYDLLFELAAEQVGVRVPILKLHGSCNFWPRTGNVDIKGFSAQRSVVADVEADVDVLTQPDTLARCEDDDAFAPALALYAEGKLVRVCPQFVRRQLVDWEQAVTSAAAVFLIGVRTYPQDDHIWSTLANTRARLHYFGREGDAAEFQRWASTERRDRASHFHNAVFADTIPRIEAELQVA
jgi:putative FmdB family regulatory protein